jgi:hypothetical protein
MSARRTATLVPHQWPPKPHRPKIVAHGCGVVYVAEQTEPVRRPGALKVIKLGMDTKQVVARFEAERRELVPLRIERGFAHGRGIAFSPVGRHFAASTATTDGRPTFRLWELSSTSAREVGPLLEGALVLSASFSADGRLLAAFRSAGANKGRVTVWEVRSQTVLTNIPVHSRLLAINEALAHFALLDARKAGAPSLPDRRICQDARRRSRCSRAHLSIE